MVTFNFRYELFPATKKLLPIDLSNYVTDLCVAHVPRDISRP